MKRMRGKIVGNCQTFSFLKNYRCSLALCDATALNGLRYEGAVFNEGHERDNTIASVPKKFYTTGRKKFIYPDIAKTHANQLFF